MLLRRGIASWNSRGLWVSRKADRARKLAVLYRLARKSALVALQEVHATPGIWDELLQWALFRGLWVLGDPTSAIAGGLVALVHKKDKDLWRSFYLEKDSTQVLQYLGAESPGEVINVHLAPISLALRREQIGKITA